MFECEAQTYTASLLPFFNYSTLTQSMESNVDPSSLESQKTIRLEQAGGDKPNTKGSHSCARVGQLSLLSEDPVCHKNSINAVASHGKLQHAVSLCMIHGPVQYIRNSMRGPL